MSILSQEYEIDVNEIETSIRAWEVLEARARIRVKQTDEGRYNYEYSYVVRTARDKSMVVDSSEFGEWINGSALVVTITGPTGFDSAFLLDPRYAPNWVDKGYLLFDAPLYPLDSFQFSVTAFDTVDGNTDVIGLVQPERKIPVKVVNQSTKDWVRLIVDSAEVAVGAGLFDSQISWVLRGHLELDLERFQQTKEFKDFYLSDYRVVTEEVSTLRGSIEVVDESGFPVESIDVDLPSFEFRDAELDRNYLSWCFCHSWDAENMLGEPTEVVIRLFDDN